MLDENTSARRSSTLPLSLPPRGEGRNAGRRQSTCEGLARLVLVGKRGRGDNR
jgi:hypothetical protein